MDYTFVSGAEMTSPSSHTPRVTRTSGARAGKVSTYLLAIAVGEFESTQTVTSGGTLLRVLCTPGRIAKCGYALRFAARVLEFYNGFFGVPFPPRRG